MKPVLLRLGALGLLVLAVLGMGNLYAPEPIPSLIPQKTVDSQPTVRVAVARTATAVEFFLGGDADLAVRGADGRWLQAVASRGSLKAVPSAKGPGISFDGREFDRLRLTPRGGQAVGLRWNEGKGDQRFDLYSPVEVYRSPDPKKPGLRAIAHVPLETYLAGVVAGELPSDWPRDALMAQAIAARTYTAYYLWSRWGKEKDEWDLHYQAQTWKPSAERSMPARDAVAATAGQVMYERGNLFPCYYHSECGGSTANVRSFIAVTQPVVALSGVRCPRCSGAPGEKVRTWRWAVGGAELVQLLARDGKFPAGRELVGLDAYDDSNSGGQVPGKSMSAKTMGRVAWMRVRSKDGAADIRASEFRLAVGETRERLSSTWFRLGRDAEERYVFEGRGWGHGVGLCQWGTRYMAKVQGKNYIDILRWYYPGVDIALLYSK